MSWHVNGGGGGLGGLLGECKGVNASKDAFTDFEVVRVGVAKFRREFVFLVVHRYLAWPARNFVKKRTSAP